MYLQHYLSKLPFWAQCHPTISKAINNILYTQHNIFSAQDQLLQQGCSYLNPLLTSDIEAKITKQVEVDQNAIQSLQQQLRASQKIRPIIKITLSQAEQILANLNQVQSMISEGAIHHYKKGECPPSIKHNLDPDLIPYLTKKPEWSTFWGSRQVSAQSYIISTLVHQYNAHSVRSQRDAFVFYAPMPSNYSLDPDYSLYQKGQLGIVHSGFVLGGQRYQAMQDNAGPEDCSSWIVKLLGWYPINPHIDTQYLQYIYRSSYAVNNGYWPSDFPVNLWRHCCQAVTSFENALPGDIVIIRYGAISEDTPHHGHTGILVEIDLKNDTCIILSNTGNIHKNTEGKGLQHLSISSLPHRDLFILRPILPSQQIKEFHKKVLDEDSYEEQTMSIGNSIFPHP